MSQRKINSNTADLRELDVTPVPSRRLANSLMTKSRFYFRKWITINLCDQYRLKYEQTGSSKYWPICSGHTLPIVCTSSPIANPHDWFYQIDVPHLRNSQANEKRIECVSVINRSDRFVSTEETIQNHSIYNYLETVIIRAGALSFSMGNKRFVNKKCPKWFVPICISRLSDVTSLFDSAIIPALFIRMCSLLSHFLNLWKMLKTVSNECH